MSIANKTFNPYVILPITFLGRWYGSKRVLLLQWVVLRLEEWKGRLLHTSTQTAKQQKLSIHIQQLFAGANILFQKKFCYHKLAMIFTTIRWRWIVWRLGCDVQVRFPTIYPAIKILHGNTVFCIYIYIHKHFQKKNDNLYHEKLTANSQLKYFTVFFVDKLVINVLHISVYCSFENFNFLHDIRRFEFWLKLSSLKNSNFWHTLSILPMNLIPHD